MSKAASGPDPDRADRLTDEERALFRKLADDYEDEPIGRLFDRLAQPDEDEDASDSEVANS